MRIIQNKMSLAFIQNINLKEKNDEVTSNGIDTAWFYHGNCIAKKNKDGLFISNCGFFTKTTKERLNMIPGVSIYQQNKVWILEINGKNYGIWDGKMIKI
jgi:hypothetical protein